MPSAIIISIKIVHEVHPKGSKYDTNKKVMKYTKTQWKKRQKYTVYKRLEQIAEINTLMSFLVKSTDGTYTIFFLSMINSSTHETLL